jgi:hypothetical protein
LHPRRAVVGKKFVTRLGELHAGVTFGSFQAAGECEVGELH